MSRRRCGDVLVNACRQISARSMGLRDGEPEVRGSPYDLLTGSPTHLPEDRVNASETVPTADPVLL
jgi:hypothetical protein